MTKELNNNDIVNFGQIAYNIISNNRWNNKEKEYTFIVKQIHCNDVYKQILKSINEFISINYSYSRLQRIKESTEKLSIKIYFEICMLDEEFEIVIDKLDSDTIIKIII